MASMFVRSVGRIAVPLYCVSACALVAAADPPEDEPPAGETDTAVESPADEADREPSVFDINTEDLFRIDRTIVTARKWAEDAQDVPGSLRVLDDAFLESAGVRTMRDASFYVPNLHIQEFSSRRLSFPTMRGIGAGTGDPAVITYIDGVPQLSISSTNIPLLDVERIEFLRGPQGSLYGRSAIGGLMHIHTARPSNTPTVFAETNIGNYDLREFTLSFSSPIVEDHAFITLTGTHSERDGYTDNIVTGHDVDDRNSQFGRAQVLITPDERNEFRITFHGEHARDGAFTLFDVPSLRAKSHTLAHDFEGETDRDIRAISGTWNHWGETIDFTSITSFTNWDVTETSDFDFSPIDGVRRTTEEDQRYFYQEFRVSSSADAPVQLADDIELRWLVGTSVFSSDSDRLAANDFRPGGAGIFFDPMMVGVDTQAGTFEDLGLALFGQATFTFGDRLDVTAGLRLDYEDKEADVGRTFSIGGFPIFSTSTSLSDSYTELLPSFSVAYRFCDGVMAYASAARGFRAGGFNLAAPIDQFSFGPETSWTFETGVKTLLWDERIALNASAFFIEWEDLQLTLFDPAVGGYVDNAGSAESIGFEVELLARPIDGLELFAGVGVTETEIDDFVDQYGVDVSGNDLANVPEFTWHAGVQFTGAITDDVDWFIRAEYIDVGTFYYDAGNRLGERYALLNLRAGVDINERFRIEVWARNLLDDEYIPIAFQPSPADPTAFVGESGAPMTFGIRGSITF